MSLVDIARRRQALRWVGALTLVYALLWFLAWRGINVHVDHYLPLHTTMETAAIIIAMLAFGIAWNAYAQERPGNIVLMGAALFGTGLLDFVHMLSYAGMPDLVTPASPQKAIGFWLAPR
jgi:hypothetical protein